MPNFTAAAGPVGSLAIRDATLVQGQPATFDYATPRQVSPLNWIGLYTDPGSGPIHQHYVGPSLTWQRAPGRSGTDTFDTLALLPRDYIAFYLHDDGYRWLADPVRFTVRAAPHVDPPDFVGAFAGPGGGRGQLAMPAGLDVGADGVVWVADAGNDRVQAFGAGGRPLRTLGSGMLAEPADVAVVGDGSVLVADGGNQRVVHLGPDGSMLGELGSGLFTDPRGVCVDSSGLAYASDAARSRVLAFDLASGEVARTYRRQMSAPRGVAVDGSGTLWVAQSTAYDAYVPPVIAYGSDTAVLGTLGTAAASTFGALSNPAYLACSGSSHLLVAAGDFGWVSMFRTDGPFLGTFGTRHSESMRFPAGIAARGSEIYVAEAWNAQILHYRWVR